MGNAMSDELNVLIESSGHIKLLSARLKRWLGQRPGLWQLVPTADNLVIFSKLGKDGETTPAAGERSGLLLWSGSIGAMGGIVDVITFIYNSKRSGVLVALNEGLKKSIFFTNGDLRMATSNLPEDRLGALLYRFGTVTQEQLDAALTQVGGERRLGRVLLEMGVLTAHDLYQIIRKQVEEIFYSVLLIRAGSFYFYQLTNQDRLPSQIHVDTQQALLDGVRRMDEMSYFRERIPDRFTIVEIRQDIVPKGLSEKEQRVYDLIDGMCSVDEIARESRLGEFETTKVIFHLIQLNFVQRRRDTNIKHIARITDPQRQAASLAALAETFNTVFCKIFAEVKAKGRQPVLESGLGSFFEGATGYVELFRGVTLRPDGSLDSAPLLANLAAIQSENPIDFLYSGLNELLFFEMFTVGDTLTREDEENLQQQLAKIFRDHAQ
jgi:hypothetical protein